MFSENKIPEILDFAITQVKPKSCVEENEWFETPTISSINFLSYTHPLSADVLFLCMRYAHYFHTEEFLSDFFDCVIECIINAVEVRPQ